MEDHGGELVLEDRAGGGARVSLIFKSVETQSAQEIETMSSAGLAAVRKISPP
jgi:hypothetical protein